MDFPDAIPDVWGLGMDGGELLDPLAAIELGWSWDGDALPEALLSDDEIDRMAAEDDEDAGDEDEGAGGGDDAGGDEEGAGGDEGAAPPPRSAHGTSQFAGLFGPGGAAFAGSLEAAPGTSAPAPPPTRPRRNPRRAARRSDDATYEDFLRSLVRPHATQRARRGGGADEAAEGRREAAARSEGLRGLADNLARAAGDGSTLGGAGEPTGVADLLRPSSVSEQARGLGGAPTAVASAAASAPPSNLEPGRESSPPFAGEGEGEEDEEDEEDEEEDEDWVADLGEGWAPRGDDGPPRSPSADTPSSRAERHRLRVRPRLPPALLAALRAHPPSTVGAGEGAGGAAAAVGASERVAGGIAVVGAAPGLVATPVATAIAARGNLSAALGTAPAPPTSLSAGPPVAAPSPELPGALSPEDYRAIATQTAAHVQLLLQTAALALGDPGPGPARAAAAAARLAASLGAHVRRRAEARRAAGIPGYDAEALGLGWWRGGRVGDRAAAGALDSVFSGGGTLAAGPAASALAPPDALAPPSFLGDLFSALRAAESLAAEALVTASRDPRASSPSSPARGEGGAAGPSSASRGASPTGSSDEDADGVAEPTPQALYPNPYLPASAYGDAILSLPPAPSRPHVPLLKDPTYTIADASLLEAAPGFLAKIREAALAQAGAEGRRGASSVGPAAGAAAGAGVGAGAGAVTRGGAAARRGAVTGGDATGGGAPPDRAGGVPSPATSAGARARAKRAGVPAAWASLPRSVSLAWRQLERDGLVDPNLAPATPSFVATTQKLFTPAEDDLLALGIERHGYDWESVCDRYLPGKTPHQAFVRKKKKTSSAAGDGAVRRACARITGPLTAHEVALLEQYTPALQGIPSRWEALCSAVFRNREARVLAQLWSRHTGGASVARPDKARRRRALAFARGRGKRAGEEGASLGAVRAGFTARRAGAGPVPPAPGGWHAPDPGAQESGWVAPSAAPPPDPLAEAAGELAAPVRAAFLSRALPLAGAGLAPGARRRSSRGEGARAARAAPPPPPPPESGGVATSSPAALLHPPALRSAFVDRGGAYRPDPYPRMLGFVPFMPPMPAAFQAAAGDPLPGRALPWLAQLPLVPLPAPAFSGAPPPAPPLAPPRPPFALAAGAPAAGPDGGPALASLAVAVAAVAELEPFEPSALAHPAVDESEARSRRAARGWEQPQGPRAKRSRLPDWTPAGLDEDAAEGEGPGRGATAGDEAPRLAARPEALGARSATPAAAAGARAPLPDGATPARPDASAFERCEMSGGEEADDGAENTPPGTRAASRDRFASGHVPAEGEARARPGGAPAALPPSAVGSDPGSRSLPAPLRVPDADVSPGSGDRSSPRPSPTPPPGLALAGPAREGPLWTAANDRAMLLELVESGGLPSPAALDALGAQAGRTRGEVEARCAELVARLAARVGTGVGKAP